MPKFFTFGRGEIKPTSILITGEYETTEGFVKGIPGEEQKRPGQLLWLLGLTRLQTQVCLSLDLTHATRKFIIFTVN